MWQTNVYPLQTICLECLFVSILSSSIDAEWILAIGCEAQACLMTEIYPCQELEFADTLDERI